MDQNLMQSFEQFLATQSVQLPIISFVINLLMAAFLSVILTRIYVSYGDAISNRKLFARNILLLTMTTMLIITIVKSSLALSLGLVGALSIVRFRAAIKEPEELAYLFLAIAIGLGFGADQAIITSVAFFIIMFIVVIRKKYHQQTDDNQNLHLTVYCGNPHKIELNVINDTLKKYCTNVDLKRFDETSEALEVTYLVDFEEFEQLVKFKQSLQELSDSVKITFLDNKGIM